MQILALPTLPSPLTRLQSAPYGCASPTGFNAVAVVVLMLSGQRERERCRGLEISQMRRLGVHDEIEPCALLRR
jgi:hypothetical protein